jgi:hypothetical protein
MSYRFKERRTPSTIKAKASFPFLKGKLGAEADLTKTLTDASGGTQGLVQRLLSLCEGHEVSLNQIPRIIPGLGYTDTLSKEALLRAMTPELVDQFANTFGVTHEWMDGTSKELYQRLFCYESPRVLFDFLDEHSETLSEYFPLRLLATKGAFDRERSSHELALVAVHEKEITPEFTFQWFTIFGDSWIWSHPKARLRLKALARALWLSTDQVSIPIIETSYQKVKAVREGKLIPFDILHGKGTRLDRRLEDYALTASESQIARETDEVEAVLACSKEYLAKI